MRKFWMLGVIALCMAGCGESSEGTGSETDTGQPGVEVARCDPAVTEDVYKCAGRTRVVCKSGEEWVDESGSNLGTYDCASEGLVCHEAKLKDGTVYDAYCTQCTESDLANCKVADEATMVPVCLDNGFEGMICDFDCKPRFVRTDEGSCVPE